MKIDWKSCVVATCLILFVMVCSGLAGGEVREQDGKQVPGKQGRELGIFLTDVPEYKGNVILGRPTDHSITLSIFLRDAAKIRIAYGPQGKGLNLKTDVVTVNAGEPREITLDGLDASAAYQYRVLHAETREPLLPEGGNGSFRTCRAPGSAFIFTVQADSHLDGNCLPELYKTCLANAAADKPDFHIDLGDTFMTGKRESRKTAALQYAAQRYYFGLIGHSAPVFLVIGNHDGEETNKPDATVADGPAVWSCLQRKRLFPNPTPDGFYMGNAEKRPHVGLLQDYYAWKWGDALFVVLDPYWSSRSMRGGKEPWNMTLGKDQYDWLAATLRASKAKYKLVFIHQLTGGLDQSGRGSVEAATLYEWGGHEKDGKDTFETNRPGWEKPIHRLLVETKVTIVFHGHDHFFARQQLDGIIYQLVPQPSQRNFRNHHAEEYGYKEGVFLPSSGHIRVRVSPEHVAVDYIRAAVGQNMGNHGIVNAQLAYSYICNAGK